MAGLCFEAADDALLAGGWPRQMRLVDGHPNDKNPAKSALAVVGAIDPKYFGEWPREVAYRFLRAGPVSEFANSNFDDSKLSERTKLAVATPGPLGKDEAKATLIEAVSVANNQHTYEFKADAQVYGTEAILGADETLDAIATGLERAKLELPTNVGTPLHTYYKSYVAGTVGFLLLRASKASRAKLVARFEEQYERFEGAAKKHHDWSNVVTSLDMSLHGAAAVKRFYGSGTPGIDHLDYAHDDPDYILQTLADEPREGMSVRLVRIAGLGAMKGLAERKFTAPQLGAALRDFGMIRAPETVELVLSLVGKSSVKDAPKNWLVAHADYARPIVSSAAKRKGPRADLAKAVLKML